jgi:hypothetical protein
MRYATHDVAPTPGLVDSLDMDATVAIETNGR